MAIISKIAGVELMPQMDLEIGHVNLMVKSDNETQQELDMIDRERQSFADDEGIGGCPWEDDKPVVGWHTDSYPFVCVLMLSDCTNMVGGETALQTGRGDILKVRGPEMVRQLSKCELYITDETTRAVRLSCKVDTLLTRLSEHWVRKSVSPWSPHFVRGHRTSQMIRS